MTIGIDANWAIFDKTEIGRYGANLIKTMLENDPHNSYVLFFSFFPKSKEKTELIRHLTRSAKAPFEVKISLIPQNLRKFLLNFPLGQRFFFPKSVDLLHFLSYDGIPQKLHSPSIVTIHELTVMRLPFLYNPSDRSKNIKLIERSLRLTAKQIAVSVSTKKDMVSLLGATPSKINVIYEGVGREFAPLAKTALVPKLKKYSLTPQKYLLAVGSFEPRKNLPRLVRAYAILPHFLRQNYPLVLVGSEVKSSEFIEAVRDLNLKDQIRSLNIPEKDLSALYAGAKVFLHPSLHEGFGLPILEAMAAGTPVICAQNSSLPEIVGKAGIFINPESQEEMARTIQEVLESDKLASELSQKSLLQAKKFSWRQTALETISLYEKTFKEHIDGINRKKISVK